jgi:diguanylate cyclase (GGDEF)-like protein
VVPVTASFGVATYPDTTSRWEGLFQLADRALYQAKREGRNRVRSIAASADAAAS